MDTNFALQVGIVIGLIEICKTAFITEKTVRFVPLMAHCLGLVTAIFVFPQATLQLSIQEGIKVGLSSVGLFSGVKTTAKLLPL